MPGRTEGTRSVYQEALTPLLQHIGAKPLRELTAGDVRTGLEALSGRLSTRYLQIATIRRTSLRGSVVTCPAKRAGPAKEASRSAASAVAGGATSRFLKPTEPGMD
jgi:hypothetical protein